MLKYKNKVNLIKCHNFVKNDIKGIFLKFHNFLISQLGNSQIENESKYKVINMAILTQTNYDVS